MSVTRNRLFLLVFGLLIGLFAALTARPAHAACGDPAGPGVD